MVHRMKQCTQYTKKNTQPYMAVEKCVLQDLSSKHMQLDFRCWFGNWKKQLHLIIESTYVSSLNASRFDHKYKNKWLMGQLTAKIRDHQNISVKS